MLGVRGSADLIFSTVVFEIKVDLQREIEDAEAIHEILENSTTKEEFIRLAKAKLREYKNPWIEDTLQFVLNLDLAI